jgi:4-amino-4-deoxy-L-arabinose transferase-like glycosyltransferase
MPSVVAGILTVPVTWLLVREITGSRRIAGVAALLLATNPLHIWYSQEARPYAIVVWLGSLGLLCLIRAVRGGNNLWWAGFAVLSSLAFLTHVAAVVFPIVGGLWALHTLGRRSFVPLTLSAAGAFALTLPFLLTLLDAVRNARGTGSPPRPLTGLEVPYSVFTFLAGYSFGPPVREIQDLGWRAAVSNHWVQTALIIGVLLWLALLVLRSRRPILHLTVLLLVPLAAATAGSLITTKAYNVRYVLPALVGFLGLVAVGLGRLSGPPLALGLGAVLGLFARADVQWFVSPAYWKEDSRAAAACLIRRLPPGSTVAVAPAYMRRLLVHYARDAAGLQFISVADLSSMAARVPDALAVSRSYHLPVTEAELVRAFEAHTDGPIRTEQVVGYRLYFSSPVSGRANRAPCRVSGGMSE